jgi:hypothetical protein
LNLQIFEFTKMTSPRFCRSAIALAIFIVASVVGCTKDPTPPSFTASKFPPPDELRDRIDKMVDHTRDNRTLKTDTHNAWQIVHGILPYGKDFKVEHNGQLIGALEYLLEGGELKGWDLRPGDKGVIAILAPGSKEAQGHPDQWIGYLSQCNLAPDDKLVVGGKDYEVGDLMKQALWDVKPGMEGSWTLMAASTYFPADHKWTASDGQEWTTERLAVMESGAPLVGAEAACGGTHRLYALSRAINRHLQDTGTPSSKLTGGWKKVDSVVQDCVKKARAYQQPNGSFSTNFFARAGSSPDIDNTLHATGHTLEWLVVALDDNQFNQDWVTAAVVKVVQLLEENQDRELDCGALYHAARGLMLYRQRKFGERTEPNAAAAVSPMETSKAN